MGGPPPAFPRTGRDYGYTSWDEELEPEDGLLFVPASAPDEASQTRVLYAPVVALRTVESFLSAIARLHDVLAGDPSDDAARHRYVLLAAYLPVVQLLAEPLVIA